MRGKRKLTQNIILGAAGSAIAVYAVRRLVATSSPTVVEVEHVVTIRKPAQELYALWRQLDKVPQWMHGVRSVERLGPMQTRWTVEAMGGGVKSFEAETTEDVPGVRYAWRALPDSGVDYEGQVSFDETLRGTEVRGTVRYSTPLGMIGAIAAGMSGREPGAMLKEHLRRFKQLAETGEIATNEGPSGRQRPKTEPGVSVKHLLDARSAVKNVKKSKTAEKTAKKPVERNVL